MKKKYALFCSIIFFSIFKLMAQNVSDLETFEKAMKLGTQLTYDVSEGGKKYQLIATIKKLGDEILFDYKTTEPNNKTGTLSMNVLALSKADALVNVWNGGDTKLDKETSLFISKKTYAEIGNTSQTSLKVNGQSDTLTLFNNTISEFGFNIAGNFLSVPGLELEGGSNIKYIIDVIESLKFPLITRMDLGWTITLVDIKAP